MEAREIDGQTPQDTPGMVEMVQRMYDLLGSNMTAVLGHAGPEWRTAEEFQKWKKNVFAAGLEKGTSLDYS